MANASTEIEIFILIDADGDYVTSKDKGDIDQLYLDEITDASGISKRFITVKLNVPLPAEIVVSASIPAEPNGATVSVK